MTVVLKGAQVFHRGAFSGGDVSVSFGDRVFCKDIVFPSSLNVSSFTILPGFVDVHVHLREPGFSYKETIRSGTLAAAHGGFAHIAAMPNLNPVPDCAESLALQRALIEKDALVHVHPYGAITVGEKGERLADLAGMAPDVIAFSDDGRGVQSESMMRQAMAECRHLGKILAAHCEDNALLRGGYIHDGAYARAHGHKGISSESEWRQLERDLELVRETGCAYHMCHVSTKESVALIRRAKAQGLDVTCETAPHYLVLTEDDLREDGSFKMNPPLRTQADRDALLEGILDGTVDMIATDHAPHSAQEKARGLAGSAMGIVGLETAFPILYTHLVRTGVLTLDKLVELMAVNPRKRFGFPLCADDYAVWDLNTEYRIDPAQFCSMGKSTPFAGQTVYGRCVRNVCGGAVVWQDAQD